MNLKSDKLKKNRERYQHHLQEIRADRDLTLEAKARRIRPVYEAAKTEEAKLLGQMRSDLGERVRGAERRAFVPPRSFNGDPTLVMLSNRDAFERAAKTSDARELEGMLERSCLYGESFAFGYASIEEPTEGGLKLMRADDEASISVAP